ncbi:MAG: hypothetical protein IT307_09205 [Chloroflexi bacterium]|nr:hypothetical protein [Chloroflexota bacterium]
MGLFDRLKKALGGSEPAERDAGHYFFVRCNHCGDCVRVRLNLATDLQQEFGDNSSGVAGYFVRKIVIDQRCFQRIEAHLTFDVRRQELTRDIDGGTFVSREEYEQATAQKQSAT